MKKATKRCDLLFKLMISIYMYITNASRQKEKLQKETQVKAET